MNEKIHYDQFIEQIVQESGYDERTVREYVSNMFETIILESTHGNPVKLRNFGSFQPRWYKAKRGINPQTRQPLDILPHYHIHFASSKVLKNAVNNEETKTFFPKLILVFIVALLAVMLFYFSSSTDEEIETKIVKKTEMVKPVEKNVVEQKVIESEIVEEQVPVVIEKPLVVEQKEISTTKESEVLLYPGTYTVTAKETLSEIGLKVYDNIGYWPILYSANNSQVLNPDLVLKGSLLDLPDKPELKSLYNSYMEVHNAYMERDRMSKSFWILCEGSQFMGKNFQMYLQEQLIPAEYAIIERCSK